MDSTLEVGRHTHTETNGELMSILLKGSTEYFKVLFFLFGGVELKPH
jgi:hypothetical protein